MRIKLFRNTRRFLSYLERRYLYISYCNHARNGMKQTIYSISRCLFSSIPLQDKRTFRDIVALRKEQAEHSVLVELPADSDPSHLYDIYPSCGQVKKVIDWKSFTGKNFFLVEFNEVHAVKALLHKSSYRGPNDGLPTFSRLLYLKNVIGKSCESSVAPPSEMEAQDLRKTNEFSGNSFLSKQIEVLCQREKLKDIHIRLRFLMCTVLEDTLKGILPNCRFIPIGSTVNGFGSLRSDLNLFLAFNTKQDLGNSNFCHSTKKALNLYKNADSHILCTVGDILEIFVSCISGMKKNMLSTPSVIRFQHDILGISCSLTINDMSSMFMSELLFLCAELDLRVRPLMLIVKQWAYDAQVIGNNRDPSITSFALTLLVIFFLQTRSCPILPPLDKIQHQGMANNFRGQNYETLDSLLKDFFHFIGTFDFRAKSISVNSAKALTKPDFSPLYIQNPMDEQQNLCKNVTQQKLDNLTETAGHTLWNLENISPNSVMNKDLLELLLLYVKQASISKS